MSSIAWSHCLCSGRILKSSFANTNSNPLTQLGRVRSPFHVSEARWASSTSFWEIVEVAQRSSAAGSRRILVIKSLSPCSYSTLHIWRGVSSFSESSAYSRGGPDQQMLTALASIFLRDAVIPQANFPWKITFDTLCTNEFIIRVRSRALSIPSECNTI